VRRKRSVEGGARTSLRSPRGGGQKESWRPLPEKQSSAAGTKLKWGGWITWWLGEGVYREMVTLSTAHGGAVRVSQGKNDKNPVKEYSPLVKRSRVDCARGQGGALKLIGKNYIWNLAFQRGAIVE